jgi:glycosyltransferase involved in cell wall biosynthesis
VAVLLIHERKISLAGAALTMKVVHVITGLGDGGAEGVLTRVCCNSVLVSHVVITLSDLGKYGPILAQHNVLVYSLNIKRFFSIPEKVLLLIRIIKHEEPDVVQTWMYHSDFLGGIAARIAGVRTVFWGVRHSSLEKTKTKNSTLLVAKLCAALSSFIPTKILCCANSALDFHAKFGYRKSKMAVVYNGYDINRFYENPKLGSQIRDEFGFGNDEFIIGMVGRYDPLKDHHGLLLALSFLKAKGVSFKCLLVGKAVSECNGTLHKELVNLGLKDRVVLAGQRSDVPAIMNALDLHVLSSSSEAFPNVLAEAMACGIVCVSTNVGDAELILGENELCCTPNDPYALSELIHKMIVREKTDKNWWKLRKLQNIKRISEHFSQKSMIETFERYWLEGSLNGK